MALSTTPPAVDLPSFDSSLLSSSNHKNNGEEVRHVEDGFPGVPDKIKRVMETQTVIVEPSQTESANRQKNIEVPLSDQVRIIELPANTKNVLYLKNDGHVNLDVLISTSSEGITFWRESGMPFSKVVQQPNGSYWIYLSVPSSSSSDARHYTKMRPYTVTFTTSNDPGFVIVTAKVPKDNTNSQTPPTDQKYTDDGSIFTEFGSNLLISDNSPSSGNNEVTTSVPTFKDVEIADQWYVPYGSTVLHNNSPLIPPASPEQAPEQPVVPPKTKPSGIRTFFTKLGRGILWPVRTILGPIRKASGNEKRKISNGENGTSIPLKDIHFSDDYITIQEHGPVIVEEKR